MGSGLGKLHALAACACSMVACGSSPSNFYDSPTGAAGRVTTAAGAPGTSGGASASGGASTLGGAGASGSGTVVSGGNGGGAMGPGDAPCSPAKDVMGGMSGPFGTTGPACFRVTDDIKGWGCSSFDGRTVKVNGEAVECAAIPLPDKINGAYYFDFSAGAFEYASFYWF